MDFGTVVQGIPIDRRLKMYSVDRVMSRCKNSSQQRAGKQPLRALERPATAIYDLIELLSDGERRNLNQQRETMKKTSNMPKRSLGMGTEAFPAYALCYRQGKPGLPAKIFFKPD